MLRPILSLLVFVSLSPLTFAKGVAPDLVVVNARVRTMDRSNPTAEAFAVLGGRIVAVGTTADMKKLTGRGTRIIDAGGKLVLPGFNDAHVHFLDGGMGLSSVNLRYAKSQEEFTRLIGDFAKSKAKGRWILNGAWDHENWTPNNLPTRQMIDPVTADNPVFVERLDGHMGLANSLALKLAGITKETKDPEGGVIVRDSNGEPTGILKDAAMNAVYKAIPEPSLEQKMEYLEAASRYAASLGVTSVQDMSAGISIAAYQELLRQGRLKTRVYAVTPLGNWKRWANADIGRAFGSDMLRVGGLKGYADGSLGSTTAWFFEPYLDAPDTRGLASDEMPLNFENTLAADKAGIQVMIHAIGDRANDEILKIFERVAKENGQRDRRFRIEHAQHLNPELIKRFGADGVIASMEPFHAIDDGRWAWKRIDAKRIKGTYAFRDLIDSGARLAFGTDWFVAPLNPMWGIFAATTRRTLDGRNPGGWVPEQKISVEETVQAYTVGSAYAEFQEKSKGRLAPGMLADFVILSDDIFSIAPEKIWDVTVLTTVVDGRVVYEKKSD